MAAKVKKLSEINKISKGADIIIKLIFGIAISITCVYPLLMVLGTSLTENSTIITNGYNVVPKVFSLEAYRYVLVSTKNLLNAYGITLFVTIIGSVIGVTMMSMYAYALSRKDLKYRKFLSMFAYITFVFNGGLVPFYFVYSRLLGLGDTIAVLIIPYLVDVWYIVILRTFFTNTIPDSIFDSAKIDGAGELRTFFQIVLPLAIPGITTVILFTVLKYWNDFQLPLYFIESGDKSNIQFLLYRIMGNMQFISQNTRSMSVTGPLPIEAARMAMCVLGTGPMLIAYPFFQRYFVKGLTMGAVKG